MRPLAAAAHAFLDGGDPLFSRGSLVPSLFRDSLTMMQSVVTVIRISRRVGIVRWRMGLYGVGLTSGKVNGSK